MIGYMRRGSRVSGKSRTSRSVNNAIYNDLGHAWWDDGTGEFSTIRYFINPVRSEFFLRVLRQERPACLVGHHLLDIGCGGGLLAEEFARAGFRVTGIDPSPRTIDTARAHADQSGLDITYRTGRGERLPYPDATFDHVACCDVLEHVDDVDEVIGEAVRVLRPGGLFLFDTVNRTIASRFAVIKVMQEWRSTAFAARDSHVWERFIRPDELSAGLVRHGFEVPVMRGISSSANPIACLRAFRRRAGGRITFKELGRRLALRESSDLSVSYMGYAAKRRG
jgi:2-polyprenyl-6-hydroxyphenyl methylase/3-demethylubiquinone-9 3-methyltransferase